MPKNLKVVDIVKWIEYPKAKWVASEFNMHYQRLTEKLGGSKINDTNFVYGYLQNIENGKIYTSDKGIEFKFIYRFYNKNKMLFFYIVKIENKLVKISNDNGAFYLDKLDVI